MGKQRSIWYDYVKKVISKYPDYEKELRQLQRINITTQFDSAKNPGVKSRVTEIAATKQLPFGDQERYEAVKKAIKNTNQLKNGNLKYNLIDIVYFKKRKTLEGAAFELYISYSTALRWNKEFIYLTAKYLKMI